MNRDAYWAMLEVYGRMERILWARYGWKPELGQVYRMCGRLYVVIDDMMSMEDYE